MKTIIAVATTIAAVAIPSIAHATFPCAIPPSCTGMTCACDGTVAPNGQQNCIGQPVPQTEIIDVVAGAGVSGIADLGVTDNSLCQGSYWCVLNSIDTPDDSSEYLYVNVSTHHWEVSIRNRGQGGTAFGVKCDPVGGRAGETYYYDGIASIGAGGGTNRHKISGVGIHEAPAILGLDGMFIEGGNTAWLSFDGTSWWANVSSPSGWPYGAIVYAGARQYAVAPNLGNEIQMSQSVDQTMYPTAPAWCAWTFIAGGHDTIDWSSGLPVLLARSLPTWGQGYCVDAW